MTIPILSVFLNKNWFKNNYYILILTGLCDDMQQRAKTGRLICKQPQGNTDIFNFQIKFLVQKPQMSLVESISSSSFQNYIKEINNDE